MSRSHPRHARRLYLEVLERRELPATYTVVNTSDAGTGSLRQAILNSNTNGGQDTIDFNIGSGPQTITPLSALPTITDSVNIAGFTQPGFTGTPIIEIDGSNAGAGVSGLNITAGSCQIFHLAINRFAQAGILLSGSGNVLLGNFLGTDISGSVALANRYGVFVNNSNNNAIGTVTGGNLISGNANYGVYVTNNSSNNTIEGNFIGTDYAGTVALGNMRGVVIGLPAGANNNTVGGPTPGSSNLISGNSQDGVFIDGFGNNVLGNRIGTNWNGTAALPNGRGIFTNLFAQNTLIGGTTAGTRNIISGNTGDGILLQGTNGLVQGNYIGTDITGTMAIANGNGIGTFSATGVIGGTTPAARNIISGNSQSGVFTSFSSVIVQGNYIGTDFTGTMAVGNQRGVLSSSGNSNQVIGGTSPGAGNLISGNSDSGISLQNSADTVQGNLIGTDATGTIGLGNGVNGIDVFSATGSLIGGAITTARNVISANGTANIRIFGGGITVQGNYIGTDIAGGAPLWPTTYGVSLWGSGSGTTIGGTVAGAGNLISGNSIGIDIAGHSGNLVQGNRIGTDAAGIYDIPNDTGVVIRAGSNNTIGGAVAGAGNLISGNTLHGILITVGAPSNLVQGNYIGTNVSGTVALANGGDGVRVDAGANFNTIGGPAGAATNILSGNAGAGVHMNGGGTANNTVIGNRIGTDVTGTAAVANNIGVLIDQGANNNLVGGTSVPDRNIISGNQRNGVAIGGNGSNANRVEGNYIGTDWTGSAPLANPVGVSIFRLAQNNIIGGTSVPTRNVISGNTSAGVSIRSNGTTGNLVQGNYIGTDPTGNSAVANRVGVTVINSASGSLIEGNSIAFNTFEGVVINNAVGNQIRTNNIGGNGSRGIRLLNNGNNLQPFPTITSVVNGSGSITISGSLVALPTTTYALEFFSNPVCDGSGFGEGQTYLGMQSSTTNGGGFTAFSATFTANVSSGYLITSTATRSTGDTSEFSACLVAPMPLPGPDGPSVWLVTHQRPANVGIQTNEPLSQRNPAQQRFDLLDLTPPPPRQSTPSRYVSVGFPIYGPLDYLEVAMAPQFLVAGFRLRDRCGRASNR